MIKKLIQEKLVLNSLIIIIILAMLCSAQTFHTERIFALGDVGDEPAEIPLRSGAIEINDYTVLPSIFDYPSVKKFDFLTESPREDISEDLRVPAKNTIVIKKREPDEYFGVSRTRTKTVSTGESVTGIDLWRDGTKGECGCMYYRMFQYEGQWIDVKTTYMDWDSRDPLMSFFSGGFADYHWSHLWYMKMKHEFFISDTDTAITINGFLEYSDVDNLQGMLIDKENIGEIWANKNGTVLGCDDVYAGDVLTYAEYVNRNYVPKPPEECRQMTADRDMVRIQATVTEDIKEEGEENYSEERASETFFAFTFSGDTLNNYMIDDDMMGSDNRTRCSDSKHIPSAFPESDSGDVSKKLSDEDEIDVEHNHVRNHEEWKYSINAIVPLETEVYNFYNSFALSDCIDSNLTINDVKVYRADEDVSDYFDISIADNIVTAEVIEINDPDFYGYTYSMQIRVSSEKTLEELEDAGVSVNDFAVEYVNQAIASYDDDSESKDIETNEVETTVQYERMGDVEITKEIASGDMYSHHGNNVFIFNLRGINIGGDEREYNGCLILDSENRGTLIFENVPEGEYVCSEYDSYRFDTNRIDDVRGGVVEEDTVIFNVGGGEACEATFYNEKTDWSNYSDSDVVINNIGSSNI